MVGDGGGCVNSFRAGSEHANAPLPVLSTKTSKLFVVATHSLENGFANRYVPAQDVTEVQRGRVVRGSEVAVPPQRRVESAPCLSDRAGSRVSDDYSLKAARVSLEVLSYQAGQNDEVIVEKKQDFTAGLRGARVPRGGRTAPTDYDLTKAQGALKFAE